MRGGCFLRRPSVRIYHVGEIRDVRVRVAAIPSFDEEELVRHRQTGPADQDRALDAERALEVPCERPVEEDRADVHAVELQIPVRHVELALLAAAAGNCVGTHFTQ
jgi:hypothetical protein